MDQIQYGEFIKDFVIKLKRFQTEYGEALKFYLQEFGFEWFCTLNIERKLKIRNVDEVDKILRRWTIKMSIQDHIQVAYMGLLNRVPHDHVHLLMLGKNRYGHTLLDKKRSDWEHAYKKMSKNTAEIKRVRDMGASSYIADHNTPLDRFEMVMPYNRKLLGDRQENKNRPRKEFYSLRPPDHGAFDKSAMG